MSEMKQTPVNTALGMPLADTFEADATAMLLSGCDQVLAAIDLDSFDAVNKNFDHQEGDRVLIETGKYIEQAVGKTGHGRVYRYGGDEFFILYSAGEEKEDVFLWMEQLRRDFDVKTRDDAPLTISIGISASPEDGATCLELVRKAEGAMLRAKQTGRNRVSLAREEKMVTKTSHYTEQQLKRLTKASQREGIGEAVLLREALDMLLKKYDV